MTLAIMFPWMSLIIILHYYVECILNPKKTEIFAEFNKQKDINYFLQIDNGELINENNELKAQLEIIRRNTQINKNNIANIFAGTGYVYTWVKDDEDSDDDDENNDNDDDDENDDDNREYKHEVSEINQ